MARNDTARYFNSFGGRNSTLHSTEQHISGTYKRVHDVLLNVATLAEQGYGKLLFLTF